MNLLLAALIPVVALASTAWADRIFDLAKKPRQTAVLTLGTEAPSPDLLAQPPMLRRIGGVITELTGKQLSELCDTVDSKAAPAKAEALRVCVVHIAGPAGERHVSIEQDSDGVYVAEEIGAGEQAGRRALLKAELVDRLLGAAGFSMGRVEGEVAADGANGQASEPRGEVFEVAKPYQVGLVTLNSAGIKDRIGSSPTVRYDPTMRELQKETIYARLPANYDLHQLAGLLVWMDPSPGGRPPRPLWETLDKLGMICVGPADVGNSRRVTERVQLALDAVATAKRRWRIDPAQVYVTGVSGGGKMSSELLICFPDLFAGAVSIVGLNWYENVPSGEGRLVWAAEYSKPSGKRWEMLRQRRLAAVTGSKDFNQAPVTAGVNLFLRDKLDVRLFDIEGMGHEFPAPAAFAEHLAWVREPVLQGREKAESAAVEALEKAHATDGAARRAALLDVVAKWPWTSSAWEAAAEIK